MLKNAVQWFLRFVRGLSFKLSFYAGLIMFLALLAFAYHSISSQEQNLTHRVIQGALKDSEVIKAAIWNGMMTKDRKVIRDIVTALGARGGFEEVKIYDRDGMLRYSSRPHLVGGKREKSFEALLQELENKASVHHRISDDGKWIRVVNPLLNTRSCSTAGCHATPGKQKVLGALAIKLPLEGVRAEIFDTARKTILFAFLLFVLISSIIGLAVIFLVNPHLRRLQQSAARMARGEYSPEAPSTGSDEIAELSRSFDEMSRQINERTTHLAQRRKMYKSLFEEVPCYLTVVSRDYRIVRANRAFRDQFGDHVGENCFVGYKDLDSRCADCPVEKTFSDGRSHQSEEVWKVNGDDAYVIVNTAPIFDDEGNIAEVLEMSLDVTKLKQLQVELEKKQEEYKYLFENVPCYLTVVDQDFNVIQANEQFETDFGKHIGEKCFSVYKHRESKCENCPVEQTFIDGATHSSEHLWLRNGEETNIIATTAPVRNDKGEIMAVMEMCTNVTEIKRLQSELALLGETIAGMSHTIKNILSGLQGGVYIVDSGLARGKEEKVRQGWDMVKRNVEKISDLVQGILYASKERKPEYRECDPGELLWEVCDLYETKVHSEGVELVREFEREMGSVPLDPAGIHSAVANLLSNALEACRNIRERPPRITVTGRLEDKVLAIRVSDNGIGMPQEVKDRLFGKFYSTKGSRGTGLGLVITKKVIEEHGGTITVESEAGEGTSFIIEIPFELAEKHSGLRRAV